MEGYNRTRSESTAHIKDRVFLIKTYYVTKWAKLDSLYSGYVVKYLTAHTP